MLQCPRLSFQGFPHLVFDHILHFLDVAELVALSQTCRDLHLVANRVLYGQASQFCTDLYSRPNNSEVRIPNRFLFLEECISLNPQNARYLREYSAYTLERLEKLLPQVPLTFRLLDFPSPVDWFQDPRFENTVSEIHVDTVVEEITAMSAAPLCFPRILNESEKLAYFVIPSVLHQFRGLKKFTITIPNDYLVHGLPINPASIINHVNCPHLEHLVFNGPGAKGLAYPSKSLSNLKYLEINSEFLVFCFPQFLHAHGQTLQYYWTVLTDLRERNIPFRYYSASRLGTIYLIDALQEQFDTDQLMRWSIESEYKIQLTESTTSLFRFKLAIRRFRPSLRNKLLQILSEDFPCDISLELRLTNDDRSSIQNLIPRTVVSLSLDILDESLVPNVIPDIIASLPALEGLYITVEEPWFEATADFPESILVDSSDQNVSPQRYIYTTGNGWFAKCDREPLREIVDLHHLAFQEWEDEILCLYKPPLQILSVSIITPIGDYD